ncbi:MAG TPA: glycogen debranching enzyme, partial [Thermoanaerobaculia bacterium]|nr:glycogen debranching enzyme [Thermoanaerobaculia bacterium]
MHSALMKQEPDPRERTLRLIGEDFRVHPGLPLPLGASRKGHELNFSVFSRHATSISLVLFDLEGDEPLIELPLDAAFHRTGDLWHIGVDGLPGDFRYGWRAGRDGDAQSALHRFDAGVVLLDPYATAIDGLQRWGKGGSGLTSVFVNSSFDWEFDRPPGIPLAEKIIYELHVRGFTAADPEVANPGTFQALAEKIPYLLSLGVTTVELLPVYEFDEGAGGNRVDPATGKPLVNFWGYSPLSFFAVKSGYAVPSHPWDAPDEFRSMVRAFHKAGLEVFLDVVF